MAFVDQRRAIVDFHGLKLSGRLGWLMWLAVHMVFLTGFTNRVAALLNWVMVLGGTRRARIFGVSDLAATPEAEPAPARPAGAG